MILSEEILISYISKMKKSILIVILIPFLCFSQNTNTDKVVNQINSATDIANSVIGLFKKNKNVDKKSDKKTNNKNSATITSDGTFSVNAKPEDIVANIYKCTYKNFDEYTKRCVWKPTSTEINKLRQNSQDDYNDWLSDPKLMFVAEVSDSTLTFKQNGIDNVVITTTLSTYSLDDKNTPPGWANMGGFIRFQTTDGKRMKFVSNEIVLTEMNFGGGVDILKLDEENIFYKVISWEGGTAAYSVTQENIYSLDGKFLLSYVLEAMGNATQHPNEIKIDEANKLIKIVEPRVITDKKGKVIKETYKTIETYQYGNGTITEIKQPVATKKK